jgi:leucyl aminopeptidase
VEFPLWDEYAEELKSDIADLKNTGSENAGMITAGKFLEHFTAYPYIHLQIAGLAYAEKPASYHGKGGTGYGVRLLFEFLKRY